MSITAILQGDSYEVISEINESFRVEVNSSNVCARPGAVGYLLTKMVEQYKTIRWFIDIGYDAKLSKECTRLFIESGRYNKQTSCLNDNILNCINTKFSEGVSAPKKVWFNTKICFSPNRKQLILDVQFRADVHDGRPVHFTITLLSAELEYSQSLNAAENICAAWETQFDFFLNQMSSELLFALDYILFQIRVNKFSAFDGKQICKYIPENIKPTPLSCILNLKDGRFLYKRTGSNYQFLIMDGESVKADKGCEG